jgi:hypothetical protein
LRTTTDSRRVQKEELLKAEWIVLIGEALVATGSVIVVIGLIRAFKMLIDERDV